MSGNARSVVTSSSRGGVPATPVITPLFVDRLPSDQQTTLLRAMLWKGARSDAAWAALRERIPDLKMYVARAGADTREVLPMLYASARQASLAIESVQLAYLRIAYGAEQRRAAAYQQICARVLTVLEAAGVPNLLLGGPALAEPLYGDWALRHCHDITTLVKVGSLCTAQNALIAAGFERTAASPGGPTLVTLRHESGLPVRLCTALFQHPTYRLPNDQLWARSRAVPIRHHVARALSDTDCLIYTCLNAVCSGTLRSARWACDAWYLIGGPGCVDWKDLCDLVSEAGLDLPIYLCLRYLAYDLEAAVPAGVLARLATSSSRRGRAGNEAALFALGFGKLRTASAMLKRGRSWRVRFLLLRWLTAPPPFRSAAARARQAWR